MKSKLTSTYFANKIANAKNITEVNKAFYAYTEFISTRTGYVFGSIISNLFSFNPLDKLEIPSLIIDLV